MLWQLGELANAHGDVATAAAILEGCVTEFAAEKITIPYPTQTAYTASPDGTLIYPYPEVQPVVRVDKADDGR